MAGIAGGARDMAVLSSGMTSVGTKKQKVEIMLE